MGSPPAHEVTPAGEKAYVWDCASDVMTYHVGLATKYMTDVFKDPVIKTRLTEVLQETAKEIDIQLLDIQVSPDFVLLQLQLHPFISLHKAVSQLKGATSKKLRAEFKACRSRLPTLWPRSYALWAPKTATDENIMRFIVRQRRRGDESAERRRPSTVEVAPGVKVTSYGLQDDTEK